MLVENLSYCGDNSGLKSADRIGKAFSTQNKQTNTQKQQKLQLTFFFCTCSFSEALDGLRLSIFLLPVVPRNLRTKCCESPTPGSFCRHQSRVVDFNENSSQEDRAALHCCRTRVRRQGGSHVATTVKFWFRHRLESCCFAYARGSPWLKIVPTHELEQWEDEE